MLSFKAGHNKRQVEAKDPKGLASLDLKDSRAKKCLVKKIVDNGISHYYVI